MPFQPMQQQPVNENAGPQNGMPPAEQAEELFKQQFHQSAYSVLFSKFSDLAPNVVTFKIMHVDPENGDGVGAFVILYNNRPLYIPVIMTDGQLKPIEIVYYKELNMFLPLNKDWLDEVSNMSLDSMGQDVEIPQDVPRDMDVRPLIYPPITPGGRIGYASDMEYDIKRMFKQSEDHFLPPQQSFLKIVQNAPKYLLDGVKLAFQRNPNLLKKFVQNYGVERLTNSMEIGYSKIARELPTKKEGHFKVFTQSTPTHILKEAFGKNVGSAFSHIVKNGFIVQDTRRGITKIAIKVENSIRLEEPGSEGGWFKLYFVDGPAANYFIIPWPNVNRQASSYSSALLHGAPARPLTYLCIREDGNEAFTEQGVIGERLYDSDNVKDSKIYKILAGTSEGTEPKPDSYGFFLHSSQKNIEATEPEKIRFVISDGGLTKYVTYYGPTYIIDDDPTRQYLESQARGELVYLPKSTQWIELVSKVTDENDPTCCGSEAYYRQRKNSIIKDPKLLTRWMNSKLQKLEATPVKVKSAGYNQWWIEGSDRALFLHDALEKVACKYGINAKDAGGILVDAQENGISYTWVLDKNSRTKMAAELYKMAQPPGPPQNQAPPGPQAPPMDPSMQQLPPPPPAVHPTDLAIGEAVQQLTQQNELQMQQLQSQMQQSQQAMEMQQQNTQQLIGILQGIQQRSTAIAQAAQGTQLPPETIESPAAAAEFLAPNPPPEPEPPPMPVMEGETPSPDNIAQEINPELVDQVDSLQDEGIFDTAAVSMLAASPALQDIVASYVPNMEKCLDNLGRVLLTLWLTESDTRAGLGDETFVMLEDKLRTVFKSLGETILAISQNALASSAENPDNKRVSSTTQ